jgi:2-hydroxyacyl-CoA lyase 1
MLLLGGSYERSGHMQGFFQETDQLTAMRPYSKFAERVEDPYRLPIYIAEAIKKATHGTPGPAYLDLPGDIIQNSFDEDKVVWAPKVLSPRKTLSDPADVEASIAAIKTAEQPLVIFGKGVNNADAAAEMREFVERTGVPYLAMPMAKGIIPDDHPQSAAAARSFILQNADLIVLVGARLNWMLHFGLPPRFREDVRVIQLDFNPEEIGVNVATEVALVGDAKLTLGQMIDVLDRDPWQFPQDSEWLNEVGAKVRENLETVEGMKQEESSPLGYYRALRSIDERLPDDIVFVSEGASTMDISRTVVNQMQPRTRLDASSYGSMGLGHGFAIAAAVQSGKRVICLQGDAAFGFAGTECEVAVRHNLPITWIVFNNGGIGGNDPENFAGAESGYLPAGAMNFAARYDIMMEGLGGTGFNANNSEELDACIDAALKLDGPSLINVPLAPDAKKKPQKFAWLTRT